MIDYTALITGGNKGIGADLSSHLLNHGYTVVSVARRPPEFKHKNLLSIEVDLLEPDQVVKAAKDIAKSHNITHLVHNAGLTWPNLIEDAKPGDITGLAQLHLGAALTLTQAALPKMKSNKFGRIIVNGFRAALGVPTRTAYSATKAAIIGMARTWALELAKHGITVNVVAPGPIGIDNFWSIIEKDSPEEVALAKRIPVGRLGTTEDVSSAFLFFCDPKTAL